MLVENNRNQIPERAPASLEDSSQISRGANSIDFDKILSQSNAIKNEEVKQENWTNDGSGFHVGESKNDKDFREQLEKITGKKQGKAKNALDKDDYLTLLVTQLKYQDPSKPMENHEMASQMAQFNTVEQLVGVNKSLTDMGKAQAEAKIDKLSQYIGKYLEINGNQMRLEEGGQTNVARFELPSAASNVVVDIQNPQGKVIRHLDFGSLQAGSHNITWDGMTNEKTKALPGQYTFQVMASTDNGKPLHAKNSFLTKAQGIVDLESGGKIDTLLGAIEPNKVVALRDYDGLKIESSKPQVQQSTYQSQN